MLQKHQPKFIKMLNRNFRKNVVIQFLTQPHINKSPRMYYIRLQMPSQALIMSLHFKLYIIDTVL